MSGSPALELPAAPKPGSLATLAWAGVAVALALVFVLVSPATGFACGVLLFLGAVVVASQRRPELLLIGSMAAATLGNAGRVFGVGDAAITVYQAVFFSSLAVYIWMVVKGRERLGRSPADLWLALLLAAAVVAVPAAQDLKLSIVTLISLASSVLLVYLTVGVANTAARLRATLVSFVFVAAVFGGLAVLEHFRILVLVPGNVRAHVTFHDPNVLGGVLAAAAAVGIPIAATERRLTRAVALWCAIAAAAIGLVMTLSRGAFLGLVFGAIIAVFVAPMRRSVRIALVAVGALATAVLLAFVLTPTFIAAKITGIATDPSALYRVYLAESGMHIFAVHPLGVGPGNWPNAMLAYRDTRVPVSLIASHMTYLTIIVEEGILGIVGVIGALVAFFRVTWRAARRARAVEVRILGSAALAGFVVLFVQSMTYSLDTSKFFWFMVGAGLAAAAIARSADKEEVP